MWTEWPKHIAYLYWRLKYGSKIHYTDTWRDFWHGRGYPVPYTYIPFLERYGIKENE